MATPEQMKSWLDANADKAGTPDFIQVSDDYSKAVAPAPSGGMLSNAWEGVKGAVGIQPPMAPGVPIPTLQERLAKDRGGEDPNSWGNIGERAFTNVVTAIPDTGSAIANIGLRAAGREQIPYLSQMMRANAGGHEMPANAGLGQRAGEGMLAALAGGGLRGLIPGALGVSGAEAGAKLGETFGLDQETMAILGGALAGTGARPVATNINRGTVAALYGRHGAPNANAILEAGERTGTVPTGAMLGDDSVQRLEQVLERRPAVGQRVMNERQAARNQFTAAADAVPPAAGATMTTPTEIGRATQETAGAALTNLENRSSGRQQMMETQIGPQTPVNVAGLDRLMSQIPGQTTPEVSGPVTARLNTLRSMYPEPDPNVQGPPAPVVDYGRLKDWRGNLLNQSEGYPPVTGHHAADIKGLARQLMRDTAVQQGVPPHQFDATQMLTRQLNDQYRPTLEPLTPRATTDYETVYNRGPAAFDTNPQAQQDFRSAVNAGQGVTAGDPAVNNILASRINDLLAKTLHVNEDSAMGPIKFANAMRDKMDPATLRGAVGPAGAQTLNDVAELARSFHRPTVSGGGTRSLLDIANQVGTRVVGPALTGLASHYLGADPAATLAAGTTVALSNNIMGGPIDVLRHRMLNSEAARNAMAGRPMNIATPTANDLRATMNAVIGSTPRGLPIQPPPVSPSIPISR